MGADPQRAADADVVVIGGGIIGCATTYYLARRGRRVILCEQKDIASEQSSRAWGYVRQQGRHPYEVPLAKAAMLIWDGLSGELQADTEFVRGGILAVGETEADAAKFRAAANVATEYKLTTRLVGADEIRDLVPELAGNWNCGLYTAGDGHAEPAKTTRAFAAAAARQGASIRTRTRVVEISLKDNKVQGVLTESGPLNAATVVCASGLNGYKFLKRLGLNVPVRSGRSNVIETNPTSFTNRTAVWGPYIAYRPTGHDTYYVGNGYRVAGGHHDITIESFSNLSLFLPTYVRNWSRLHLSLGPEFYADIKQKIAGLFDSSMRIPHYGEPRVSQSRAEYFEREFYKLMPHLAGLGVKRAWAGTVDLTPDVLPAVGKFKMVDGLYVATGLSGHGFALGPILGKMLSEYVLDGTPSIDLSGLDPHRFAEGKTAPYYDTF
jgi:glycine/D-amino acid oxidase-like deaminating enzyme